MAETCNGSPQHLVFLYENQRGAVRVFTDQVGPERFLAAELNFTVRGSTPGRIQIIFDDELSLNDANPPVMWEFRTVGDPGGYCWHREDWPENRCINTVNRCESALVS